MRPHVLCLLVSAIVVSSLLSADADAQPDYTLFESDPVRPIALSPNKQRLFVVNTPDGHLEIYDVSSGVGLREASVSVGLEPVAVAARNNDEVWVVNHMSDSVSVIDLSVSPPRVVRTLLVGDEPRDIVFAGPGGNRAFITTAHRGQNSPYPDGEYDVPGTGRADVWVFDATSLGSSLGGVPLTIVSLFGDRPRALATSPDGSRVYAAVYRSGNRTVAVGESLVCNGTGPCNISGTSYPGGVPQPRTNIDGIPSRQTGIIVGFEPGPGQWRDELDRNWNNAVPFSIPDLDVFEIDADAAVPNELGSVPGVGTILFNMIANPANGNVYVTNTDANNRVRFEGVGAYAEPSELGPKPSGDPASVRGNIHKSRITVLDASGDNLGTPVTEFSVAPRHLNKHIDYDARPTPVAVKLASVATPLSMAISDDGSTLYVAAFGSDAVAVYDTSELENDTFTPSSANLIPIIERPSGLALDDANDRLYVATRNRFYAVDTASNSIVQSQIFFNPEDVSVRAGRKFLYNAVITSGNGEASCSSCHVFGDLDDLAWDLGDPDGSPFANPNPVPPGLDFDPINDLQPFDPLKGPMTTQSLRGMSTSGPMHWRGDRTGGSSGGDPLDENAAFNAFNVAFPGLLGRDEGELDPADMQSFTNFALRLSYPPNPIRALDNSLTPQQQAGLDLYTGRITDAVANCEGCHQLDRAQGFFGTGGGSTFEAESMEFKVPHLRNAYQKVGMFGQMPSGFFPDAPGVFTGDQVRATGYLHDGSVATAFDFLSAGAFSIDEGNPRPDTERRALEALIMAFETDLAPIVGQQVTLTDTSGTDVDDRITLLINRAGTAFKLPGNIDSTECELIVKGVVAGEQRGWLYLGSNQFDPDVVSESPWTRADLEAAASVPGQPLTFTCVPPGSGVRMGINRDRDPDLDGDDATPGIVNPPADCRVGPTTPMKTGANLLFLVLIGLLSRFGAARRRRG